MKNPYPYTEDNKRYQTWNYYTKTNYGTRLYKVPLDAGFTCPNRDGTINTGGCIFCGGGSNSFPEISGSDIYQQYLERRKIFTNKWPVGKPMAYFQSYTNTYGPLQQLQSLYQPFLDDEEIQGLVIATRSDCLNNDIISYLKDLTSVKDIWLELGLQSIHDKTLKEMNRGHDFTNFMTAIESLQDTGIKISVHLIDGWPTETIDMMMQTAKAVGKMPITAVKIHMLHVLKDTTLGKMYLEKPFPLLSKQQYAELVADQLTYLREDMVIERITGDGLPDQLIEPLWTVKKISVINDIDKVMAKKDLWQGKNY